MSSTSLTAAALAGLIAATSPMPAAFAGDAYWDGAGPVDDGIIQGGAGTWTATTGTSWTDSDGNPNGTFNGVSVGNPRVAIFGGTLPGGNVELDSNVTFSGITFNTAGYSIVDLNVSNPTLTTNLATNLLAATGVTGNIGVRIAGSGAITVGSVTHAGTIVFTGDRTNTFSGLITIAGGTLQLDPAGVGAAQRLGNVSGSVTISGGNLDLGTLTVQKNVLSMSSGSLSNGLLQLVGAGASTISGGTVTGTGQVSAQTLNMTGGTVDAGGKLFATNLSHSGGDMGGLATASTYTLSATGNVTSTAQVTGTTFQMNGGTVQAGAQMSGTTFNHTAGTMNGTVNTTGTYTLTAASTGTVGGSANITAGTFDQQNGDVADGATIAATTFNQSGGNMGGNVTVSGTYTLSAAGVVTTDANVTATDFNQTGGTMSGVVGGDTYNMSGGTMGGTVNSFTFLQTGGTATGALDSEIEVIAIGGTIDPDSGPDGIQASNAAGDITVNTTALGDIDNTGLGGVGTGAGIETTTTGVGNDTTMTLLGTVQGITHGINATGNAGSNIEINAGDHVTGGNGAGVAATTTGGGTIVLHITPGGAAIVGTTAGANLNSSATTGLGIHSFGSSGVLSGGIGSIDTTAGADILVENYDLILGTSGNGEQANSFGGNINIEDITAIQGATNGILANSGNGGLVAGAGNITVTGSGVGPGFIYDFGTLDPSDDVLFTGIVGTGGDGINANALGLGGTGGNITIGGLGALANGNISGLAGDGLDLVTNGGTVNVIGNGAILGGAGNGVLASSGNGATTAGVITIQGNASINGAGAGFDGILANAIGATTGGAIIIGGALAGEGNGAIGSTGGDGVDADTNGGTIGVIGNGAISGGAGNGVVVNSGNGATTAGVITIRGNASISGAGLSFDGINAVAVGTTTGGDIVIGGAVAGQGNGAIGSTGGDGIDALTNGGLISVIGNGTITGGAGNGVLAVSGNGAATAGAITIRSNGAISGNGLGFDGVNANASGTAAGGDILIGGTGALANNVITGNDEGLDLTTNFAGTITVTTGAGAAGNVTGTTGNGILTTAAAGATAITVSGSTILGNLAGMDLVSASGTITVNLASGSQVTGTTGGGIVAGTTAALGTVTILGNVVGGNNGSASGGTTGLLLDTNGQAITVVDMNTVSGNSADGIDADTTGLAGGAILIQNILSVTGNTIAGDGISALTDNGAITVDDVGTISGATGVFADSDGGAILITNNGLGLGVTGATFNGIDANATNLGLGGNVTITGNGAVSGNVNAIVATTDGLGIVTIATGGALTATTGNGVDSQAVNGNQTITISHLVTAGSAGVDVIGLGLGNIVINQTANTIEAGAVGIVALQNAGATGDIDIDLAGTVNSAGTGVDITGLNAATQATLDIAATGVLDGFNTAVNVQTLSTFTLNNLGDVIANGANPGSSAINLLGGTALYNNDAGATTTGMLNSILGSTLTVSNDAGATWTFNTGGNATLNGTDTFGNDGLVLAYNNTLTGLETFNNNLGGILRINGAGLAAGTVTFDGPNTFNHAGDIDMNNGVVGDSLVVGDFNGTLGSTMSIDVDALTTPPFGRADDLTITGTASGDLHVIFNGQFGALVDDTVIIDVNAGSIAATDEGIPANVGLVTYDFEEIGNDWFLTSDLNLSPIAAIVSGVVSAQQIINSSVHRVSSAFVTTPIDVPENTCAPGAFGRTFGGVASATGTTSSAVSSAAEAEVNLRYAGAQIGVDFGCFNLGGSGAAINFGILGGANIGQAEQDQALELVPGTSIVSNNEFDSTYIGGYATAVYGSFFADAQVIFDRTSFDINSSLQTGVINNPLVVGQSPDSDRVTVSGSAGYAFSFDDYSVVPSVGFAWSRSETDPILLVANNGQLIFEDLDSTTVFGSLAFARTIIGEDQVSATQPFITGTLYYVSGDQIVRFDDDVNAPIDTVTEELGAFGEISAGLNYRRILDASDGGLREFAATMRFDFTFSDKQIGGRGTLQGRWQW